VRLLLALAAALVLAAPAGGSSTAGPPAELFVLPFDTTPGAVAETDVDLSLPGSSSLAIASVTTYVPAGYTAALDSQPGTAVGSATVLVGSRPDRIAAGLFTADPAAFSNDACAPGLHAAVWTAALHAFPLTVFVDPTAGDVSARGAYRLVYCLPGSQDPRVTDVDLDLRSSLSNPARAGLATWRAFVTPSTGAAFEIRSIVALPQLLGLRPGFSPRTGVLTLSGRLVSAGSPRPGINVHLALASRADLSDARDLGIARTRGDGSYSLGTIVVRKKTVQLLTLIAYVNFYAGACSDPPLLPGGCAGQSIAPPPARVASVTIPRRR
jgi:hypothetical protein